jgi:hypothetical protein
MSFSRSLGIEHAIGDKGEFAMVIYPSSRDQALGSPLTFRPSTLRALRSFSRSKPWRGTFKERQTKFRQLQADLCKIYGVNPTLIILGDGTGDSGGSCFIPALNVIDLRGRLSVIPFLHEWGHVLKGSSEFEACRWSLRLFERCFPKSFARLRWERHVGRRIKE